MILIYPDIVETGSIFPAWSRGHGGWHPHRKIGSSTVSLWPLQFLMGWRPHQLRCHCARPCREIKNWALHHWKKWRPCTAQNGTGEKKTAWMSRNLPRALEINKISSPRASAHGIDHDIYPQIIQMLTHWIKVIDRSINDKKALHKKSPPGVSPWVCTRPHWGSVE